MIRSEKGFSLIELMTTVVILSILSAVVIVHTTLLAGKVRDNVRKDTLHALRIAINNYYVDKHHFPITGPGVYYASDGGDPQFNPDWIPGLTPTYIAKLPADPKGGDSVLPFCPSHAEYMYRCDDG